MSLRDHEFKFAKVLTTQIGLNALTLDDFRQLLAGHAHVRIGIAEAAMERVRRSHDFLQEFAEGKIIYGVNTGLGPMAPYILRHSKSRELQYNLIRSHAMGMGDPLPERSVRALMIARLNTLLLGKSGVHPDAVVLLQEMLNKGVYPCVYAHGGVGASGDLVQLAHLALGMIGEGMVHDNGRLRKAAKAFEEHGLKPMEISLREGLAIMNGTSVMTGIGMVNLIEAVKIIDWCIAASCMLNEIVEAYSDAFSIELNQAKLHPGQLRVAEMMMQWLGDSQLIRNRAQHLYSGDITEGKTQDKVQEYYSVRCIPQIVGPVLDTLLFAERVVCAECNSASDNPIISADDENIYHGGNFHGDYVSLEMDKLKIAIAKLSMLAERQLNYMLNSKLNLKLPPFLNTGALGLNFGFQGAQFTATSTVAENQSLGFPVYLHSISCNNDNQDIVSMGANAAHLTHTVINNTFQVLAIELAAIAHAITYLGIQEQLSLRSREVYRIITSHIEMGEGDQSLSAELRKFSEYLSVHPLPTALT